MTSHSFDQFASLCYKGDEENAVSCLKQAIKDGKFDIDGFIEAIRSGC
jgi:hypothetical protein